MHVIFYLWSKTTYRCYNTYINKSYIIIYNYIGLKQNMFLVFCVLNILHTSAFKLFGIIEWQASNLNTIRIIIIIVSGIFGGFFSKFFPLSRKAVWPTCEFLNNYICYQYNGMVLIAQHGKFNINPQFYILERD